jgi:hypothetical protein
MADDLLARVDRFVVALLDEVEGGGCGKASADVTSKAENGSGSSLADKVAVLKACTQYLQLREKLGGGAEQPEDDDEPKEPGIVDFERRIKRGRR